MRLRVLTTSAVSLALAATAVTAPPALAATGDTAGYALPSGSSVPASITPVAGGDLWIALRGSGTLASMTTAGVATARPVPGLSPDSAPTGITQDGGGRIWFTEQYTNAVSSVTATGSDLRRLPLPTAGSGPTAITLGSDGNLWFTETAGDRIGRITPTGVLTEFNLPSGSAPNAIAKGNGDWLAFTMPGANAIGRITTSGSITTVPLPGADTGPRGVTVDGSGAIWFTEFNGNRIGRIASANGLAEFSVPTTGSAPSAIAMAPDGTVWFTESKAAKVGRITNSGQITEFSVGAAPLAIVAGADGNMWATDQSNRVTRLLTGVLPTSTSAPAITGSSTAAGAVLTASAGTWTYQPTGTTYQWQRCTTADAASCTDIGGATVNTYTVTATDAGTWLRVVVRASNANGAAAAAATSALLQMGAKPIPTPVVGGATVTIASGVTASFRAVNTTKRKVLRSYRVAFNSGAVRGKVRMTLVNAVGTEVLVIAKGKWARSTGPSALSKRWKRIPLSVPRGTYSLKGVFTPHPSLRSTLAAATMTRTITVR